MLIRRFEAGEESALHRLFYESVHGLALANYSPSQLAAWAPLDRDQGLWARRMHDIVPFVALIDGQLAGFADLQPSGYIDMFFVSPHFARRGVATALMAHLLLSARDAGLGSVYSNVSLTAEPFFQKHGFIVERRNDVSVRGVLLRNATMRLLLSGRS